eukprot:6860944-Alexandrium_andersonii.AAC.1
MSVRAPVQPTQQARALVALRPHLATCARARTARAPGASSAHPCSTPFSAPGQRTLKSCSGGCAS